jgi:hypothetical protein
LPSPSIPTFDQKKRLENEPERKLGTWEKQAKQKGARRGQAMEQRAKEKEQESKREERARAREKKG